MVDLLLGRDEEVRRVHDQSGHRPIFSSRSWIKGGDSLDLVVPEGHPIGHALEAFDGGKYI